MTGPRSGWSQVVAFSAAMEMVRSERAGGFANQLFGGLLRAALAPDAGGGAVVGVLVSKFMPCLDVRSVAGVSAGHCSGLVCTASKLINLLCA